MSLLHSFSHYEGHLKEHMKILHPRMYVWNNFTKISSEVIKCNHCDKIYTRNKSIIGPIHTAAMRKHLEKKHKDKLPEDLQKEDFAKCEFCDKEFKHEKDFERHLNMHSGNRPYLCRICWQSYGLRSEMIEHREKHSEAKEFQCVECLKEFNLRRN